ncbi:hypothetical protein ACMGGQ_12640 [Enterobacter sp. BNK-13]|uniref:hypothetical protein n=1 Tax=Enterobacter sp. BNK-13 TaxID=3376150 RepID=UPI003B43095E
MITEKNNVFYCDCGFSFQRGRIGAHDCADGLRNKLAESEARCAALAAENAGLKAFGDKLNEMYDDLNGEGTGWQGRLEVVCQQEALGAVMEEFDAIKTPATDAFLAEVRAHARNEGINYAASRLAAAFNHGFVDKPLAEVFDVVRMILDTKEELANSVLPAADGLSGEYAEEFLEDSTVQLHKGGEHEERQSFLSDEDRHAFVKAFTKGAAQ